MHTLATLSCIW